MLKLLADENIPRRLVALLKQYGIDIVRLQDLCVRGISDKELVDIANKLERAILTRGSDFATPSLLSLVRNGVIYIAYSLTRDEVSRLAKRVESIIRQLEPRPGLLVVIEYGHIEIYSKTVNTNTAPLVR